MILEQGNVSKVPLNIMKFIAMGYRNTAACDILETIWDSEL